MVVFQIFKKQILKIVHIVWFLFSYFHPKAKTSFGAHC